MSWSVTVFSRHHDISPGKSCRVPGTFCRKTGAAAETAGHRAWLSKGTVVLSAAWLFGKTPPRGPTIASEVSEQNAPDGQNDGRTP
jgi:hypothetical protein